MTFKRLAFLPIFLFATQGCVTQLAIRSMGGVMDYAFVSFNEEPDLKLAEQGLGGNLKLLEALIKGDPKNDQLLLYAAQGFTAYALSFAEDDSAERARALYVRGRDYALRILNENTTFKLALEKDDNAVRDALKSFGKADVPAVFWAALSWGSYINITRSETSALADLPKVLAMMEFVLEKEPGYYYGGADMFFGAIHASTPVVLGGKPEKAKAHFEKCLSLNGGKFLLAYVYYAKTYAVQIQDQEVFENLLKKVEEAQLDILPEARLANAVAKQKAARLRAQTSDLF